MGMRHACGLSGAASPSVLYESAGGRTTFQPTSGYGIKDYRPAWGTSTQYIVALFTLSQQSSVTGAELALTRAATRRRSGQ